MSNRKTNSEFVEEANHVHNNFYDYHKSVYVNAKTKVTIICPIHGDFEQSPISHKRGQGCPKCGREKCDKNRKVWTEESFREKVSEIHPTLLFDKTIYIKPKEKVLYECPIHGEKLTLPYNLLKGCGCKQCDRSKSRITKNEWLDRFKDCNCENISYDNIPESFNAEEHVSFVCDIHGDFQQTPLKHLKSCCPKCGKENTGWTDTLWQKAGDKSKNFDSFKVYIIRCWNDEEEFYKIGKTFVTIKERFNSGLSLYYEYELIECFVFKNSKDASNFERYLQKHNRAYRYTPKKYFGGYHECFSNVVKVNPAYSSQTCSKCGHTCKENRKTQSLFECVSCGFTENADFQATLILYQRGQTLMEANVGR